MSSFEPERVTICATDGHSLPGRVYEPPPGPVGLNLLVLPGIGVPQRAFRHLGAWMATRRVRVITFDYRGMGEAPIDEATLRTASLTSWARLDAVGALRYTEERYAEPVVLLAHSFGGQALGFSDDFRRASATIVVGSQLGQPRHWRGLARLKLELYWRVVLPLAAAAFGVVPGWTGLGEPLPSGVAREWAKWGRSDEWLLSHVAGAEARYARYDVPLLAFSVSDDRVAPQRAVDDLLRRFRAAELTRVQLSPVELGLPSIGHLGLFRPRGTENVWRTWLSFAREHSASSRSRRQAS